MNEQLKNMGIHWHHAFNSMTDYVSVHDINHKILLANRAFTDLLELEPEQVIGKHCYHVIHKCPEPVLQCPHTQALSRLKPVTEMIHDYYNGNTHQVRCFVLYLDSGEVAGTVHISRDIQEQVNTEHILEELVIKLSKALHDTKKLSGLIPICASCNKIRNGRDCWIHLEPYIENRTDAKFSHSLCPECHIKLYPDMCDS